MKLDSAFKDRLQRAIAPLPDVESKLARALEEAAPAAWLATFARAPSGLVETLLLRREDGVGISWVVVPQRDEETGLMSAARIAPLEAA